MRAGQAGRVTKIHLSSGAPVTVDISLQLATDVIERWKASGPDWQLRMAKLLTEGTP
ncbi:hypothetical protein E4L98_16235 [Duganella callida]|uniref:Uncharacterized protein n=2 Tax=Duganella callida TaxID=2561932 RepID=A0A4Y9SF66_9BURK|nr:hypothetical protein E4L98_16235 [Duganella callida]